MKLLLSTLFLSSLSLASEGNWLVKKSNYSGFTGPEGAFSEVCKVYKDKVVIERTKGFDGPKEIETIETTTPKETVLFLGRARFAKLEKEPNFLCDGPSTFIEGNDLGRTFTLFSTGGCGSDRLDRTGVPAEILKDIVLDYCPKVFDPF